MIDNEHTKDRMIRQAGRQRARASTREVLGSVGVPPAPQGVPPRESNQSFHRAASDPSHPTDPSHSID
jgi:hypothetical protein